MNFSVEPLKDVNEWNGFIESFEGASFFHTVEWKELIQKNFCFEPLYLVAKNDFDKIVGACPGFIAGSGLLRLYESIPYSDYGGVLCYSEDVSHAFQEYLRYNSAKKGLAYAKICLLENTPASTFKSSLSYVEKTKGVMEINFGHLCSKDIWKNILSKKSRQNIKHIESSPLRAYHATSTDELKEFYKIYCMSIEHVGALPLDFSFIRSVWERLYPSNTELWLMGERKVVGGVFILKNRIGSFAWLLGINRKELPCAIGRSASVAPYLFWKQVVSSEIEGLSKVSFGSTPSDPNEAHYQIKKRIGATFRQQEVVWFPLSAMGTMLLQIRKSTVSIWKSLRNYLPVAAKAQVESKLLRL